VGEEKITKSMKVVALIYGLISMIPIFRSDQISQKIAPFSTEFLLVLKNGTRRERHRILNENERKQLSKSGIYRI
jgi:hypothetical protein